MRGWLCGWMCGVGDVESGCGCGRLCGAGDVAVDVESDVPGYVDSHVAGDVESGGVPRNSI